MNDIYKKIKTKCVEKDMTLSKLCKLMEISLQGLHKKCSNNWKFTDYQKHIIKCNLGIDILEDS
jgi:hypothetical protein